MYKIHSYLWNTTWIKKSNKLYQYEWVSKEHTTVWMSFKCIILSERKKASYYMNSFIWHSGKGKIIERNEISRNHG